MRVDRQESGAFFPDDDTVIAPVAAGPLSGLEFALKDLFDVAGRRKACGNPDWQRSHEAAPDHAAVLQTLLGAGARLNGVTITDELAFSLKGSNVHYGTPRNPAAPGRVPGGSSCGSAVAVASGLADFAIGTDTGGSVRIPASHCGIFGIRPTHGAVDDGGCMPLAQSFDVVGWFARDADLLRRIGDVLLPPDTAKAGEIAIAAELLENPDPAVRDAFHDWMRAHMPGVPVLRLGTGVGELARLIRNLQGIEAWRNHGSWYEEVRPAMAPDIRERMEWARSLDPEEEADCRRAIAGKVAELEKRIGGRSLIFPTSPVVPPRIDADEAAFADYRKRVFRQTSLSGIMGAPQISMPLMLSDGLPVGISVMGVRGSDRSLLRLAGEIAVRAGSPG